MNILKVAFKELVGMFIDDGALALLALTLIVAVRVLVKWGLLSGAVGAGILVVGCLLILAESVARAARNKASAGPECSRGLWWAAARPAEP